MLVMLEFSTMMHKILEYVNSLTRGPAKYDDMASKKDESLQQVLINELISKVNKKWVTAFWQVSIHVAIMAFNSIHTQVLIAHIFMGMVGVKLFVYCRFMDSQNW
jgi:hypothetical protein